MNRIKKTFRILGLILLIILASMGIGAITPFNSREKYMNRETNIEQREKREEESDIQFGENQKKQ